MAALGRSPLQRQSTCKCKCVVLAASTLHRSASGELSTHLDDASHLTPCPQRSRKFARSVGAPRRLSVTKANHLWVQVRGPGGKHPPSECQRQSRARTLRPPPASHLVQKEAASLLDQSVGAPWRPPSQRQSSILQVQVRGPGSKHSPPECQRQRRARTLIPPRTSHHVREAAVVGAPWRLRCKGKPLALFIIRVSAAETSTHFKVAFHLAPRTVEQPQSCSISRSRHGGPVADQMEGGW